MSIRYFYLCSVLLCVLLIGSSATAMQKNGFDLTETIIDNNLILSGGPPKDGIPALDEPKFIPAESVDYLEDEDRVLGLVIDGQAKAYPINILNWHELVNDRVGTVNYVVTYCPLCGTGAVFDAEVNGQVLDFGVSGLLYNSDVLLYDRQTDSLWSQIKGQGISGIFAGVELTWLPVTHTSWQRWQQDYPESLVLSEETGFERDYRRNPYGNYDKSKRLYFPVEHEDNNTFHPKETVLGITVGSYHKAYPFSVLQAQGEKQFTDSLGEVRFTILWDELGYSATAIGLNGEPLQQIQGFWFAWYAFHPETQIYSYSTAK